MHARGVHRTMSGSERWIHGLAATLLLLAASACTAESEGIAVTVFSDLEVPADLNTLLIHVTDEQGQVVLDQRIGLEESGVSWPATFGLRPGKRSNALLTIEAIGMLGRNSRVVSQKIKKSFVPGAVREADMTLSRNCWGWICPDSQTCVSGGCVDVASRLPPREDGPGCNCGAYFPFCVGASWEYDVYRPPATSTPKTWKITQSSQVTDVVCDLADVRLFLLQLTMPGNTSWKWLQVEEVDGKQRLWWRKDQWFNVFGDPQSTVCYRPRKLRLDESRLVPGEAWPALSYVSTVLELNPPREDSESHDDRWSVVSVEEVQRAPLGRSRFPLERLPGRDVLCHLREDTGAITEKKYFCFARGIGKIYEFDAVNSEQEVLRDYRIPNCPGR